VQSGTSDLLYGMPVIAGFLALKVPQARNLAEPKRPGRAAQAKAAKGAA